MILIGNRIANKITKFSKILRQNSSETITNEAENIERHKKYVKKNIYFHNKDRQLLMILD